MKHRPQVDVEQVVPVVVPRLVHRTAHAKAAGDVAEHVDSAETAQRRRHGGFDLSLIQQVGWREQTLRVLAAVGPLEALTTTGQHQVRTV